MWLSIYKNSDVSLIRQIYGQIKLLILQGKLVEGSKLPSTRWLSEDLKISRNVILEAYEQLMAEGYIESRHGSGTVVSKGTYFKRETIKKNQVISSKILKEYDNNIIDFRSGIPELGMFPRREWGNLFNKICTNSSYSIFRYCSPEGVMELRQELSEYLFRTRGIQCSPEQIVITSGSTQGLSLIAKILYNPNSEVVTEDPIHYGLLNVILSCGYSINAVPVDDKGLKTDMINPTGKVEFIYVTPSHQFPLGGVMPIQRRIELVKFAEKNNCYIIEDDYDSEFRYEGQPISSLYELEPNRVIYIGSFSKILAPALRLGYMLLPKELLHRYRNLKMYTDVHTESISQLVLAKFISEGKLEKHIWKMRKEYSKKRQELIKNLDVNFPNKYIIKGQAAGLHLVVEFEDITFTEEVLNKITRERVKVYPVESYAIHKGYHQNEIILGYGHLSVEEIEKGIMRIGKVLKKDIYRN
ncbi:PLP-dependent aminotransferase family protein [Clostridium chromiireducens]|uniref:HTH-type transcriptional regulatory protein GabR n=1 Tax=Clostridium chromiireducens TaxID=225345 RepID=A0A1V4IN30_9CLOT|nr:PLP-dependent aminotransferase family protein [Clostridium chromiireducens]OPJ61249.1 HTH-type transcriptional regulatory protein GabR [Clostridium chromiireducens]RII36073.1 PLP-dependent aminotransferase family protein [Clostridium chromiireducens]